MGAIFLNWFLQLLFTVGLISSVGMLVWLLNKAFYKLIGFKNRKVCIATGFIGTPIHEIGHAVFCILFFHKITGMRFYKPDARDGCLGYVNHSYKKRNLYHQIGNFFIGVGPIIFGSAILMLLMLILVPHMFKQISSSLVTAKKITFVNTLRALWKVISNFFTSADIGNFWWWLFIVLSGSIAIHMTLSDLDVKNSALGFGFLTVTLLILDVILFLCGKSVLAGFTRVCLKFALFTTNFFIISILVCVFLVLVAGTIKLIALWLKHMKRKYY